VNGRDLSHSSISFICHDNFCHGSIRNTLSPFAFSELACLIWCQPVQSAI
jgi:hypothetical protein